MKRPAGGRFYNVSTPPSRCNLASPKNVSTSISSLWRARVAGLVCRADGTTGVESGPDPHQWIGAAHLANVVDQPPNMQRYDWVVDNLNTHWSLDSLPSGRPVVQRPLCGEGLGARWAAAACLPERSDPYACVPLYAQACSWLNQVELWFSVLARRFLKRGNFCSVEDFETRLYDYLDRTGTCIFSLIEIQTKKP